MTTRIAVAAFPGPQEMAGPMTMFNPTESIRATAIMVPCSPACMYWEGWRESAGSAASPTGRR